VVVDDDRALILIKDPSYIPILFIFQDSFEKEIKVTVIPTILP
jgi:hypothetical protein